MSAVDGHTTKGSFVFAVGNAPLPKVPDVGEYAPPPGPLEVAGRAISYLGIAVVLGGAVFGTLVRAPRDEGRRAEDQLRVAGAAALVLGSALLFVAAGATLPPRLGLFLGVRALAGVAVLGLVRLRRPLLADGPRREAVAAAGFAAALTATLVSHATASGDVKAILLDYVHIVAISTWLGGVAALLWTVIRPTRADDPDAARALGATVWRFSLAALVAVAVIVTTGTLQSLDRLVLLQDLVETPYGLALLAKILLLAATLVFGALNLLVWGPRLRRALAPARTKHALLRSTLAEAALLAFILVASGVLTALAPPAQASGAAFDETQEVQGLRLELLLATTSPGRNRYVIRVHEGLRPVTGAEKVAFRFTMVEHDMGETEIVAEERAPGEYVGQGSATPMFGTWRVETIVRLAGHDDVRATFRVPISSQQAGAAARAIPAGAYTLILFIDPTQPAAGAPIALTVVLVDAKGDPVPGKKLHATFQGPAAAPPLDASETTPGRYTFDVAGLDAGTWQATVAVGSEAQAVYGFEVVR